MKNHLKSLILGLMLLASAATAQLRPINDNIISTLPFLEREGSYGNQGGSKCTAEPGEPPVAGQPAKNTVWYRYVAPVNGRYIVDITDNQGLRAELRFPGNPATTMPLQTFVDGTSNTIAFDEERLSVDLVRGQQVYLVVDAAQPFSFSWRFVEVMNDYYRDAETITGSSNTIIRSDRGATASSSEAMLDMPYPATWFQWTAPSTGIYHMDLVGTRQWDGFTFSNCTLKVFEVVSGAPGPLVASASGYGADNSTQVTIAATAGRVYYIACHGDDPTPDNQIWLSWYPQNSVGELVWAHSSYTTSEVTGSVSARLLKLRGTTATSARVTAYYSVTFGLPAATEGSDYQLPLSSISLPEGERSAYVTIPILADAITEPQEIFNLNLADVTGGVSYTDTSLVTATIGEERAFPGCAVATREIYVREGRAAYVELRRTEASAGAISASWRVLAGSCSLGVDMPNISGTAYLAPGQLSTTITIPVYADSVFEGTENFYVLFSTFGDVGYVDFGARIATVYVEDNNFFVPNPGSYCGLVPMNGTAALVKFTVTGIGGASGTLEHMGVAYRFTGVFDAVGRLVASFARNGRPSIGMRITFAEGWSSCNVSVRDPEGDYTEGAARRLVYDGKTTIAPQAGDYTLVCQNFADSTAPTIFMTSKVLGDGSVRFVGRTADEQTITCSGRIGQSQPGSVIRGECAFVLPMYNKAGCLWSTVDFGLGPQQPGVTSFMNWIKPWRPKDTLYPALPFQTLECTLVRYTPPTAGQRITAPIQQAAGDGSVRFINSGTTLDGTSNTLLIGETNKVTFPAPNTQGCAVTIDPKTGWFSGKIKAPGSTKFTNFYGVFLQGSYGYGSGYIPGNSRSGRVEIIADD